MSKRSIKSNLFHVPEQAGDEPYLVGSRCTVCGYTSFPAKQVCLNCVRDETMVRVKLGPKATLETFAVMRTGTPDFAPPYIVGYVKTEQGARVYTLVTGCPPDDDALEIGQAMELVFEAIKKDDQGNDLIGWKFRPLTEGDS